METIGLHLNPGPTDYLLCDRIPIKSTMDNPTTTQYANLMHNFILKARSTVREIDPQNDLTFLRIRSKKNEIMVAPDKDYFLIVIQNPTE
ncbi:dynein light chain roadblock-type 1 isoform X4 [Pteropus alecto]|uniref:dynein light chain roadblock-type 1 isoform X4 n=1 Tax=Pteropus alecto TaxID=9402 RepID=UPI00076892FB|nr:dynein light chain roadblock-type 1 isoform X4 [Pteropus alecto]